MLSSPYHAVLDPSEVNPLTLYQFREETALRDQFIIGALFCNSSAIHHQNPVAVAYG
jgi:hypothetical protein